MRQSPYAALRLVVVCALGLGLCGCTLTLPLTGGMESTKETFAGSATGHLDGAGELTLTTVSGVTCAGTFVYVNGRQGSGTLRCTDGRSGKFNFVSTGRRGTGSGTLDGAPFTFTFG